MSDISNPADSAGHGGGMPQSVAELADVFRVGVDNLDSEEFRELAKWVEQSAANRQLFETLCRFERKIGTAFRQIDVPRDLVDGIHHKLATSQVVPAQAHDAKWRPAAFHWIAATVAIVFVIGFISLRLNSTSAVLHSTHELAQLGLEWQAKIQLIANWSSDLGGAPTDRPFIEDLTIGPTRWMGFETELDSQGVVFDVSQENGPDAFMFVVQAATHGGVSTAFPQIPDYSNGSSCVGVCRRDNLVYVLVVNGSPLDYAKLIVKRLGTA